MKKNWRDYAFLFTIIGCIQFIVLSSLAMLSYGGGTRVNPNSSGYSFSLNFFSDLGRIKAFGNPNTVSAILFFITLMVASFAFAIYFIAIPGILNGANPEHLKALSLLGVLTSLFFGCIALTPVDLFPQLHELIVLLAFIFSFIVSMLMYLLFNGIATIPRVYRLIFLGFSGLIVMYGAVSLVTTFFPENLIEFSLFFRVILQKIVIYYLIGCFLFQSLGALKNYPTVFIQAN
ncbi:MAG: hypothetical protein JSW11_15335 [Candidatus Heimdallarchaeota archaeon]|nr:MAG: hypothetical protein JSW11_15335 [Candidatus Heimdallarchaeota archaeon]